ncbi:MAG: type II secretion system protein [Planctomycetes bacterium]|nr:type II secretion system protein [Planctomycetota bacterium]
MHDIKRNYKNSGFTLIELLVVISIIALLLSILMPALAVVKEGGRIVVCKSRLKQIVTGANLWAYENDDWTVPAIWFAPSSVTNSTTGDPMDWLGSLQPYTNSAMSWEAIHMQVNDGFKADLYECPSLIPDKAEMMIAEALPTSSFRGGFKDETTGQYKGYAANGYSILAYSGQDAPGRSSRRNDGRDMWSYNGDEFALWSKHGSVKLTNVRTPSKYMYFMDHTAYTVKQQGYSDTWHSNLFYGTSFEEAEANTQLTNLWRWHKNDSRANMAFYDGHVETAPKNLKDISDKVLGGGQTGG